MPDSQRTETLMRALVLECCPQSFPVAQSQPGVFGAPEPVGSFDWSKLLDVLKVILPVILNLLTNKPTPTPTPDPKPPFPV